MSIKDLIAAAYNKDATAFESAFQSVMQDKVSAAVENAFTAEEAEEDLDEEVEDLDEQTMPGNVALRLVDRHHAAAFHHKKNGNMKGYASHFKVAERIADAVIRAGRDMPVKSKQLEAASDKAFKEHPHRVVKNEEAEQIDELSKDTVRSYYNKAGEQGRDITGKMMVGGGDWSKDGKDTETLKKRAAGRAMALKRRSGEVKMSEETEE